MKRTLLLFLLFLLLVAACQSAEPEPTPVAAEPDPTAETAVPTEEPAEPDSEPTETAVPQPTNTAEPEPTATPSPLQVGTDGNPWWNDVVFYEVFVRSFYDSDGDGIGDFNGLIERLDYINDGDPSTTDDLGATGIWLMPINVSPSYHGYDVVDYYQVNPEYGTNEEFKRFMDEAHARGIRVIVDLVMNHTSTEHPWFIDSQDPDSERRDWYLWEDDDPGYLGPDTQTVWHSSGGDYYYGVFWSGMPDLNLENPAVTEEIYATAQFWLEEMNVDGFRLDAIKHLIEDERNQENTDGTHLWLEEFHDFYKSVNPYALTVGEAWTQTREVVEYTGDEVDIAFQFDLALDILGSVNNGRSNIIADTQEDIIEAFPPNQYATFITNHDQNRVMSQVRGSDNRAKLAASILLTSPGVPFIYYGEEIGMSGVKPDEDIRLPMQWENDAATAGFTTGTPWRAPHEDAAERSVAAQADDPDSLLNHYRALIQLRNGSEALRLGEWTLVESNARAIYSFVRHVEGEAILMVINLNREAVTAEAYSLMLPEGTLEGDITAVSLLGATPDGAPELTNGGFSDYVPFAEIPAFSTHIIQLQGN